MCSSLVHAVFMDVDRMPLLARNVPPAQNMKSSKLRLEAWLHGSCTGHHDRDAMYKQ